MFSNFMDIPLDKIDLDPENPRLVHIEDKLTDKEIEEYLFDEEDGRRLYKQLKQDEQIFEEVWLKEIGDRYTVKEGNRRVVASKRFLSDIESGKLEGFNADDYRTIPAKIFKEDITNKEIDMFLGTLHIAGRKDWSASNKGQHIHKMVTKYNDTLETVAEQLGMTIGNVNKAFHAFKMTKTYGKRYSDTARNYVHYYSYFDEVMKSPDLRKWKEDDPSNLDWLMELIHENKFQHHREIRLLREIIVGNPNARNRALKVLGSKDGDIKTAYEDFGQDGGKKSWNTLRSALRVLETFSPQQLVMASYDHEYSDILKKLSSSIKKAQKIMVDAEGVAAV